MEDLFVVLVVVFVEGVHDAVHVEVLVEDFDIAGDGNVACLDFARTGCRKLETLGAFTLHLQCNLLHIQDDVGHVFANASQAGEFMQHAIDLDGSDSCTLQRRQQHPAQGIAQRQAEATLQGFGDKGRLLLGVTAGALLQAVGLLEFGPVLGDDCHGVHLGLECGGLGRSGSSPAGSVGPWIGNAGRRNGARRQANGQTRRRLGGRTPLCGIDVTSRSAVIVKPTACSARSADSRPAPGPFTSTSSVRTPCSAAFLPASSAAT